MWSWKNQKRTNTKERVLLNHQQSLQPKSQHDHLARVPPSQPAVNRVLRKQLLHESQNLRLRVLQKARLRNHQLVNLLPKRKKLNQVLVDQLVIRNKLCLKVNLMSSQSDDNLLSGRVRLNGLSHLVKRQSPRKRRSRLQSQKSLNKRMSQRSKLPSHNPRKTHNLRNQPSQPKKRKKLSHDEHP